MPLRPFPHELSPVRWVETATVEDVAACIARDEPLGIRRGLAGTALFDKLAACADDPARLAALAAMLGDREVTAVVQPPGGRTPEGPRTVRTLGFAELARRLDASITDPSAERLYLTNCAVRTLPELAWTPPAPVQRPDWTLAMSGLWIGPGDQIVYFHYDNAINLICLLSGSKRVSLVPFDTLPDMYPTFDVVQGVIGSSVRMLDPDWQRFPRYRSAIAKLQVAVLEPGDMLVVPPHWWHHVESFGLNVMINNWLIPFSLELWNALGRCRAEAIAVFRARADLREAYAPRYDERVFGDPPRTAGPALTDHAAEANLAEAARLFSQVDAAWRRRARLSWRYFVFHSHGQPMPDGPGSLDAMLAWQRRNIERNARVPPI
ncbi:MAG: cupin-like domain-containing protein [Kofleriaceae bacterium]